jgi:DNA-binding transcriptional LysR family regulator
MNLEHMRMLVSIVEQGSLSAAARARRISQPAVTKQVQRMEAELGLALLVRGPRRRIALTAAGERVLVFAQETLERYESLERDLATLRTVDQGTLSLGASTIPGEYVLPALLAKFKAQYPQVEVRVAISGTSDVATKLLADEVDVGFIGSLVGRPGLRLERWIADEVVLAVPPAHAFAAREKVALKELLDQPLILREEGSGTRRSVENALAGAGLGLTEARVVLTLGSTQAILQAVAQGLGLGFVSARAAHQATADGHLACTRLADIDLGRDLYLAYQSGRVRDPLVAHFLDFARQADSGEAVGCE